MPTLATLSPSRAITRLMLGCAIALSASAAHAQASRTWVSGVGDDANPCSRTAPCKTFAGAISKTTTGGEIDALDPAGFGAVTITKPITIDGGAGQVASVLASGTNGIIINAASTDVVVLRNLSINGIGTGLSAIKVLGAKSVHVQNVKAERFTTACFEMAPGAMSVTAQLVDFTASNCSTGIKVAPTSSGSAAVSIERGRILFNTTAGIAADGTNGSAAVTVSNSTVFGNTLGLSAGNGATLTSFGNNQTAGNTTDGSFTGSATSN